MPEGAFDCNVKEWVKDWSSSKERLVIVQTVWVYKGVPKWV